MDRIIILIRLAAAIFLFYILNYVLFSTFNQIPDFISAPINAILAIGALYYVYSGRKQFIIDNDGDEEGMPLQLEKSSYFFIPVGAVIAFFLVYSSFRTSLYIDNGNAVPVEVKIASTTKTVAPNDFIVIDTPIGENEITINGKKKTINILDNGKWVYNVDNLNSYIEGTVDYADQEVRSINSAADTTATKLSVDKIIHKEFFKLESDFIFEAPETISVSKNAQTGTIHTQTVLYRLPKGISQVK